MKIKKIHLGMLNVPLKTPFKTAIRSVDAIKDVIIIMETDDGHMGYGSAPATAVITGETHGSIIEAISAVIGPQLIGQDIENLNKITNIIQSSIIRNYSAKAAVEIAVYDLFAQLYKAPLYKILGGSEDNSISTDLTISVDYIDKMVEDALKAIELGFETLKIKVGKDPSLDIVRIKAIYTAVNQRALIRLDANQGWTAKQTVAILRTLDESGVELELIEQPVKADDLDGMKYVTERVNTPVMADESSFGPRETLEIIRNHAADIINIKLMKTGGISNAIKIADIAEIYGVECMMGSMLESAVGTAAAAHIALAKSSVITRIDLDAPLLGEFNPVYSNVTFNNSEITIGDGAGLGISKIDGLEMLNITIS